MIDYDFTLKFALPGNEMDPEQFVQKLYEGGCDDALIGIGKKGRIALNFTRTAKSSQEAVLSALRDVKDSIPKARFIEAEPDLVGLTEVAELVGCSRQNIRKITVSDESFPVAVHEGNPELFHLVEVLDWMEASSRARLRDGIDRVVLLQIAQTNREVNLAKQIGRLPNKELGQDVRQACEV